MSKKLPMLPVVLIILFIFHLPVVYGEAGRAEEELTKANQFVIQAAGQAKANHLADAKISFEAFKHAWFEAEDGIKAKSRTSYRDIEDQMGQIDFAFLPEAGSAIEADRGFGKPARNQ